jgi:hypothetical protein
MSNVSRKRKLLKKEFKKNLEELRLSLRVLNYSYNKCSKIGIRDDYSDEELGAYSAVTCNMFYILHIPLRVVFVSSAVLKQT